MTAASLYLPVRVAALLLGMILLASAASPGARPASAASCQRVRRARAPRITAAQRRAIRGRHRAASPAEIAAWQRQTPPPLVLRPVGSSERFTLVPDDDAGTFSAAALGLAEQAFAYRVDGTTRAIHPRLLALVYETVRHFRVPYVHLVSGVRSGRPSSRHAQGRAIDMSLPGISDARLAAWLRPRGFVGVGIYPTSGFVHLDVRGRSYFWRDLSGPSERSRERPMLAPSCARYDRLARARGVEPVPDLHAGAADDGAEAEGDEVEAVTTDVIDGDAGGTDAGVAVLDAGGVDAGTP
jgi:uncharacterized protein YcbK (DUF882 family)